jgi:cellobiose phosphorylase
MEYGHFTPAGDEFVITRFDTPRPWMNVLFNDEYGLFFSQTGHGYSFYKYVLEAPVTYIDIFTYVPQWPQTGKFVYLRDMENGRFWPLAPMHAGPPATEEALGRGPENGAGPRRTDITGSAPIFRPPAGFEAYECRHHPARSLIRTCREGLESEFLIFVPREDPVEVWRLTLRNATDRPRRIRVFPFQELRLASYGSGATDVFTYTLGDFDRPADALIVRNNNPVSKLVYGAFMAADYPVTGYDCRLESFIGRYGRLESPAAVAAGRCTNSRVSAERMCTVLAGEVALAPGETQTLHLLFGIGNTAERVGVLRGKYLAPGAPAQALADAQAYWDRLLRAPRVETPEPALDVFANVWHKHGALLTSRYVRGGHKGFRDIIQDLMGMCPLEPAWTRRWLVESLKHQTADGLCIRGYDPLAGLDDRRWHRDSALWVPLTLSAYLRETGDDALLNEVLPFRDQGQATLWEHVLRGIRKVAAERGAHGLALIGGGDWNDSLNEINLEGRGESAWLTAACVGAARVARQVALHVGDAPAAAALARLAAELTDAVNAAAWDGDWYVYAFADTGLPVGSKTNAEGQVHLNMQTWAIFAGIAPPERIERMLRVIDGPMDTDFGPVLIHPAYTRYVRGVGKVSAKNPGHAENGPVYGHGVAFKVLADAVLGRGTKAIESAVKLTALNPRTTQERFRGEPFAAMRYLVSPADPDEAGAGWYPYFTATPAWMLMVVYEWLLGVRPTFDGLVIDPVIPASWRGYHVRRPWRGAAYEVEVENPDGVECGVVDLTLDGRRIAGNTLPILGDGAVHQVRCRLGPGGSRGPAFCS